MSTRPCSAARRAPASWRVWWSWAMPSGVRRAMGSCAPWSRRRFSSASRPRASGSARIAWLPGGTVRPEDDILVARLVADVSDAKRVDLAWYDAEGNEQERIPDVPAGGDEIIWVRRI